MKWNGGMENGMERSPYTVTSNLTCPAGAVQPMDFISPYRGCMNKSSIASIHVLSCLVS